MACSMGRPRCSGLALGRWPPCRPSMFAQEWLCTAAGLAEEHLAEPEVPTHLRQRMMVIEGQVGAVLAQCFALLKAMSEVESMVRVLQLVTVVVEVAGNSAQPYLGAFAAALPEVRIS